VSERRYGVKVSVDSDLCVGHGRCYALAPDVFAPDDFGHCEIVIAEVEGELADQARLGAENCPERAISIGD
jgi:ferredoxin